MNVAIRVASRHCFDLKKNKKTLSTREHFNTCVSPTVALEWLPVQKLATLSLPRFQCTTVNTKVILFQYDMTAVVTPTDDSVF